jgi:hypothetical protein
METAGARRVTLADSEAELARIAASIALGEEPASFAVALDAAAPPARGPRGGDDA